MDKKRFVKTVAKKVGCTINDIYTILKVMGDVIEETLLDRESVILKNFVNFKLIVYKGSKHYNIKTDTVDPGRDFYKVSCQLPIRLKEKLKALEVKGKIIGDEDL